MSLENDQLPDLQHDLILTIQSSGELRSANPPALAVLELGAEEINGHNLRDWILRDSHDEWQNCLEAAEAGVPVEGANLTLKTERDPAMMVEAKLQPWGDSIVVHLRSLNEQQRIRQALHESETQLRTVLTALPDLLMVFDWDGRYRQIYTAETNDLVATVDEMLGRLLHEVIDKEAADRGLQRIQQVIETQQPQHFEQNLIIRGEPRWFSVKVVPFGTARDPRVLWVSRDATALVEARRQQERDAELLRGLLELEQKARDVVAYEIHDGFVQYAVGTQMWLQSGLEQIPDADREARDAFETALDSIQQAIADARRMIRDLRPVTDNAEMDSSLIDGMRQLIDVMQKKSTIPIELVCHAIPPRLLPLLETQIIRIVQESLNNVLQHSGATRAKVELSVSIEELSIIISDNGQGFDPDKIPPGHYGIEGILRRIRVFGGRGEIDSQPDGGTKIRLFMPLLKPDQ